MKDDIHYKDGTCFEEIYALYNFDCNLRNIILKYLLKIENTLRALISYYFSMAHGNDNYLKIDSFENFDGTNVSIDKKIEQIKYIQELIINIQQKLSKSMTTKEYIKHYMGKYGFVPLWVLINIFSFGDLCKFLSLMKQKERVEISKYYNCKEEELIQYFKLMNYFRNLCAHDERIYNTRVPKYLYIKDCLYHEMLEIERKNGMYRQGKHDLYALIIVFKILLDKNDFNTLYNKIYGGLKSLETKIKTIDINEILTIMNFPNNWVKIKSLESMQDIQALS